MLQWVGNVVIMSWLVGAKCYQVTKLRLPCERLPFIILVELINDQLSQEEGERLAWRGRDVVSSCQLSVSPGWWSGAGSAASPGSWERRLLGSQSTVSVCTQSRQSRHLSSNTQRVNTSSPLASVPGKECRQETNVVTVKTEQSAS